LARPSRRSLSLALPLVLVIAACGAAAAPSPTPVETPRATPTAVPGVGGQPGGGGSGGNTGGGIVFPVPPGQLVDPLLGEATPVVPVAGRLNPHPVSVQLVRAVADGDGVLVELRWWSGIEPCYALDSVQIERDDAAKTIRLTVIEGTGPGDVACIDIAVLKATVVDLGELDAGTWTISGAGDAPAITVDVS
jgi:hypothetical protein